jgi:phosphoglucosamine mutase
MELSTVKRKYFGTDGIRGTSNSGVMTPEIALKVGQAAGSYFRNGDHRHKVVIGKDTRLSGYMIEPALTSGFVSAGMDVVLVGPMPTPAVAMLTRSLRADLGVMISASHNPYHDNGIKLFNKVGLKLSDEVELEIEKRLQGDSDIKLAAPDLLGRAKRLDDAQGRYIEFAKATFPKRLNLSGLKIVVDCANGASYKIAPTVLWELEADVISLGVEPNGFNINDKCGSTSSEAMCREVVKQKADIGIALDGDADRLVVCDEKGKIVDGDQLMGLIAKHQKDLGTLQGGGIVATLMSNLGLEKYLESIDLNLKRTQVGDRYVAKFMRENGYNVGGEQSGHIIMRDHVTTGDGLVAALQVLAVMVQTQKSASEVCNVFEPYPQLLKNVRFNKKDPLENSDVKKSIFDAENLLKVDGRLLIRKSGTEPLIRVMAEGKDKVMVTKAVDSVVDSIKIAVGE